MDSLFKQHLDRERLNDTTSTQRDESGDHITMLHHFLTYRSIVKLGGKKRWCKQSGIDPRKMENITKQLNRTKQSMKKCNIPIIPCPVSIPYVLPPPQTRILMASPLSTDQRKRKNVS